MLYTRQFNMRLTPKQYEQLNKVAKDEEMSMSDVARKMIKDALANSK